MADGLTDDQVSSTLDYLGGKQPGLAPRLTTLPSASAAGGGTVGPPITGTTGGRLGEAGRPMGLRGTSEPGPGPIPDIVKQAFEALKKIRPGGEKTPTRGDTGGQSLADRVRPLGAEASLPAGAAGSLSPPGGLPFTATITPGTEALAGGLTPEFLSNVVSKFAQGIISPESFNAIMSEISAAEGLGTSVAPAAAETLASTLASSLGSTLANLGTGLAAGAVGNPLVSGGIGQLVDSLVDMLRGTAGKERASLRRGGAEASGVIAEQLKAGSSDLANLDKLAVGGEGGPTQPAQGWGGGYSLGDPGLYGAYARAYQALAGAGAGGDVEARAAGLVNVDPEMALKAWAQALGSQDRLQRQGQLMAGPEFMGPARGESPEQNAQILKDFAAGKYTATEGGPQPWTNPMISGQTFPQYIRQYLEYGAPGLSREVAGQLASQILMPGPWEAKHFGEGPEGRADISAGPQKFVGTPPLLAPYAKEEWMRVGPSEQSAWFNFPRPSQQVQDIFAQAKPGGYEEAFRKLLALGMPPAQASQQAAATTAARPFAKRVMRGGTPAAPFTPEGPEGALGFAQTVTGA